MVESRDFMYFKNQCKFEKFVTNLKDNKDNAGALGSFIGGEMYEPKEDGEEDPDKEVLGFDTRFCYTREGLVVYDVHANIKLDKKWNENSGLTNEDYKAF
jgi:hypothetical protein